MQHAPISIYENFCNIKRFTKSSHRFCYNTDIFLSWYFFLVVRKVVTLSLKFLNKIFRGGEEEQIFFIFWWMGGSWILNAVQFPPLLPPCYCMFSTHPHRTGVINISNGNKLILYSVLNIWWECMCGGISTHKTITLVEPILNDIKVEFSWSKSGFIEDKNNVDTDILNIYIFL